LPRPVWRARIFPKVTIVLAVHDEEKNLLAKLENLDALDYPTDRLEVIVVSDGSTDKTNDILGAWKNSARRVVILSEHYGKANALNSGMARARGEIICFTDARQIIASDGLKKLVANFADPSVGCVSGELILRENSKSAALDGIGLYWQLEKQIRNWEGIAGSTVGVTGAFYAVRTDLLTPIPEGTILDDVFIPLQVARKGKRVIFEPKAVAWDDFTPSLKQEFHRKVRTLAGNYQLLKLAPWVLTQANPLRVQLICHKFLRLLVPFALVGMFVSGCWLRQGVYEFAFVLQIIFYALAGSTILSAKFGYLSRLSNPFLTFIVLNMAAAVAFFYFVTGKKVVWVR
jgi:cellulose synthase/poly-beta-1,6-N-acetylglucosamine synthase-like glycosyltransferase